MPGLVAGSEEGWGVVVVSGTGSNCRGWDREHKREGRVTGHGVLMGEGAGGSELMHRCMQIVGYPGRKRLPMTALADAIIAHVGAKDLEDLMRGYTTYEYQIGAEAARIVFRVAEEGDQRRARSHLLGRKRTWAKWQMQSFASLNLKILRLM